MNYLKKSSVVMGFGLGLVVMASYAANSQQPIEPASQVCKKAGYQLVTTNPDFSDQDCSDLTPSGNKFSSVCSHLTGQSGSCNSVYYSADSKSPAVTNLQCTNGHPTGPVSFTFKYTLCQDKHSHYFWVVSGDIPKGPEGEPLLDSVLPQNN